MAPETLSPQQLTAQLLTLAQQNQMAQLEELWNGNLSAVPTTPAFFKDWLKFMKKAAALDRAELMIIALVEERLSSGKPKAAMRSILSVLPYLPLSEDLRPVLLRTLERFDTDVPDQAALFEASGLTSKPNLVEAYQAYRELTKLSPGQVWQHYDWGVGIIQSIDLATQKATLSFPNDPSRTMTFEGVRKFLKFYEPDHFVSRKAKEPDMLRQLGDTQPAALVREALGSQEGRQIRQADLKVLCLDGLFTPEEWNSWWSKAREALKLDPLIDFDAAGGARALIRLREKPRTFQQEIEEQFFAADATLALKTELIRQMAKMGRELNLPTSLVERMGKRLEDDWKLAVTPSERIEVAYMLADLEQTSPGARVLTPPTDDILAEISDYKALFEIDNVDYGIRALATLLERDGDEGCRQAAELLPQAPVKLAQAIWKALDQEHHIDLAVAALQKLLDRSLENPETYIWAVRAILEGNWGHLADYFPISAMVPELLDELERWHKLAAEKKGDAGTAKSLLSKARTMLQADKFEAITRAVTDSNRDGAIRLRRAIQINNALPEAFKSQAERYITMTRKDLEDPSLTTTPAPGSAEDNHLCTARAYKEKVEELRDISSVQIPRNSKVIEEARMEGDLRENAGYQYAKEQQKMLLQQQATLTEQLSRAKVLQASEVDHSRVGFGTRFTARNVKTDANETYTILGRWETNAERNILSSQAPLAAQFIGHGPGEAVLIQHPGGGSTPYEIISIENALQDVEWNADGHA